jgi:hypothetical protein
MSKHLSSSNPYPSVVSLPTSFAPSSDTGLQAMSLPTSFAPSSETSIRTLVAGSSHPTTPSATSLEAQEGNILKALACGVALAGCVWFLEKRRSELHREMRVTMPPPSIGTRHAALFAAFDEE